VPVSAVVRTGVVSMAPCCFDRRRFRNTPTGDRRILPAIAVSGGILSDFEPIPGGESFVVLLGGDGQGFQTHVTLVTNRFDVLEDTLPGQ